GQAEVEVNAVVRGQAPGAGPVIVSLAARDGDVCYVLGEVNAPGAFPLRGRETGLGAIVAARGLSGQAARRGVLVRPPRGPGGCGRPSPTTWCNWATRRRTTRPAPATASSCPARFQTRGGGHFLPRERVRPCPIPRGIVESTDEGEAQHRDRGPHQNLRAAAA